MPSTLARSPAQVLMQSAVVAGLASGRVRAMVLPAREFGRLRRDDLLWVAEPVSIEERQPAPGELRVRYPGGGRWVPIAWPRALARPHSGPRGARGMPVACSRYSLRVLDAAVMRLGALGDGEATECGCEAVDGGWCPPGAATDSFLPYGRSWEAVGHIWDQEHWHGAAAANPEVVFVRFEAIARNIARIVPGMGSGGALACRGR